MNLNKQIKYIWLVAFASVLTFTSCKKEFFDINDSPNSPKELQLSEILPTVQLAIGQALGNDLKAAGGIWSQYWTQNTGASRYRIYDLYNISNESQRAAWLLLYNDALTDLNYIIKKGNEKSIPNYVAIATILKAYNFQVLTDAYGDIPFSEAGKAEEGIYSPKYDSQKDVYDGIIRLLKEGISKIDEASDLHPVFDDLIYQGNMHLWRKFANTTLLKVYLRLSNVDPGKAQAGIAALQAESAKFIDYVAQNKEIAKIDYTATGGNSNPLYSSFVGMGKVKNLVASASAVNAFTAYGDTRLAKFYLPIPGGAFLGIPNGYLGQPNTGGFVTPPKALSYPANITGGRPEISAATATAPVVFISDFESYFLQAEAVERGWMTGNAKKLYEDGISINYLFLDLPIGNGSPYEAYIATPEVSYDLQADKFKAIYFQKWFAMCGIQNFEAWTEGRRTGYIADNMGATLADNKFFTLSLTAGANPLPARMLYPNSEVTANGKFPGQQLLSTKVWWAK
ncbi:MAG: SusD/RagB family nutrient-binding outer membrane lipoprotein [Bacteroidia bacterium]